MKHRLIELLVCPKCGEKLSLSSGAETTELPETKIPGPFPRCRVRCSMHGIDLPASEPPDCAACYRLEISAGSLSCEKGHSYPIEKGVPVLLAEGTGRGGEVEAFAFEWLRYRVDHAEEEKQILLDETMCVPGEFAGKLVLDAGCGMGRFTRAAASYGAEIVGMDLSEAVKAAAANSTDLPLMHVIRGDLLNPPLAAASFDLVYSLGVLHHTPDTRAAFRAVAPLVKPGGLISFWLYGRAGHYADFISNPLEPVRAEFFRKRPYLMRPYWLGLKLRELFSDAMRIITVRLPHPLLYKLCLILIPFGAIPLIRYFTFSSHPDPKVRRQENFDWLSPPFQFKHTKEEARSWLHESSLTELSMFKHGLVPKIGFKAEKPA